MLFRSVRSLATHYGVEHAHSVTTPMADDIYVELLAHNDDPETNKPYKSLLGALIYVSVCTRPDISHAVSVLGSFFQRATDFHFDAATRVLRYLNTTSSLGLYLRGGESQDNQEIHVYVDTDWAQDRIDRKSYGAHLIYNGPALLGWSSKKLKGLPSLSSAEEIGRAHV